MFSLNKENYSRYGSCYVNTIKNLDDTHSGCRELIQEKGLSVQGQEQYLCRIAIDQRGEQTINRDAKTSGGIKYFASYPNAILKWTLNWSAQAKNTEALYDLANIKSSELVYKSLRPSNIMKSENFMEKITKVMTMEYLNPFDLKLENLYNLSSSVPVEASLAKEILSVKQLGEKCYKDFVDNRIRKTMLKIHDSITRNKTKLFKSAGKNVVLHHKEQVVEVNRDILGKLLAHSAKTQKAIDFKKALTYPLCPIPLCFAHPDGTRRTTAKSKLMDEILTYCNQPVDPSSFQVPKDRFAAYLVDLMALVRTLSGVCEHIQVCHISCSA